MRSVTVALIPILLLASSVALADALPPQAECGAGKVLVMSHSGGHCADAKPNCKAPLVALPDGPGYACASPAPTSCPNGWRGVTSLRGGPQCVVADCTDSPCGAGETCTPHPVCVEEQNTYYGTDNSDGHVRSALLAAPPVSVRVKVKVGLCPGPGEAAPADFSCATCEASKVCLRPGPAGLTAGSVAGTSTSIPSSGQPPPVEPAPAGRGGCDVGGRAASPFLALACAAGFASMFGLRRRKER